MPIPTATTSTGHLIASAIHFSRSSPRYCSVSGSTTSAPRPISTATMPPRVKISDVERVHHRLDAGVRAPQRNRKTDDEGQSERAVALRCQILQLAADDLDR